MSEVNSTTVSETKPAGKTPEQIEAAAVEKAQKSLDAKYGDKIVEGSARRAPEGSKYGKKILVTINTKGEDGEFDGNTREIASSDVFQVHHTVEVATAVRKQRAADKRAAAKAAREEEPAVSTEDADALLGL